MSASRIVCRYRDCSQGQAHHPHDWQLEIDDDEWDWVEYMQKSATKRGALVCGICDQTWPCETKRAHVAERSADHG